MDMQHEIHELRTRMSILERMLLLISQTDHDGFVQTKIQPTETTKIQQKNTTNIQRHIKKFKQRNIM
jgi:hypothetical protein